MLHTGIFEVMNSDLGQDVMTEVIRVFSQPLQTNFRIVCWLDHVHFLLDQFQFIHISSFHLTLHSIAADHVIK
jgi:hypothetical protein